MWSTLEFPESHNKNADPEPCLTDGESKRWQTRHLFLKSSRVPSQVAPLVRASSQYAKFAGSIPCQGTYKNQPVNAWMSGTTN